MMRSPLLPRLAVVCAALAAACPLLRWDQRRRAQVARQAAIALRDRALTMGIHLVENDTLGTIRTKIATKRLTR